ncbi:MAG: xylulokinase [Oscillospiraceae bacterium]|nr:xylulokinase [Oscillospiraceae bacterium]
MLYAGIDLGTSSVKLLLCDEKGNIEKSVTKEYPLSFPSEGWAEQNPEDWYEKTFEGLKELVDGRGAELRGLSFGGQMHGLIMLDENDNVLRPAILWNDGRSAEECSYLNNDIGRERLTELTGNIAFPGFTAPKILWVKKHEPEIFARCRKIMLPKDYLNYRLSGEFVTEPSDAAGMLLYDVKNRRWSPEMLDICGIGEEQLPRLSSSFEKCGTLKKDLAAELGAGEVIIAPGGGDNAAAAVGVGVVGPGKCSISVGTSGTVFMTSGEYTVDSGNALHSFAHCDGSFHLMGVVLSAAGANKWWTETVLNTGDYAAEQADITGLGEGSVFFLPYLMGERSPHNDPDARGVFAGLSMDTTRADMNRAVLEGVAYALRDCVEAARRQGIELAEACLSGGGAKSPLWQKILSNVLHMKLNIPACGEGPAYGAAMLAMVAAGEYGSVAEAAQKIVKISGSVDPCEELAARYDRGYERYKELYIALKGWFQK